LDAARNQVLRPVVQLVAIQVIHVNAIYAAPLQGGFAAAVKEIPVALMRTWADYVVEDLAMLIEFSCGVQRVMPLVVEENILLLPRPRLMFTTRTPLLASDLWDTALSVTSFLTYARTLSA
jgi:hypothetical protein